MSLSKFEKNAIITILIVGLAGGVLLTFFNFPPIISSVFIALGIATVVYHFLGGIDMAEFNMGPIKLGGSVAALIASAWIINGQLEGQSDIGDITLNSKYELFDSKRGYLGMLNLDDYTVSINKDKEVRLNDSILLNKLDFRIPKLVEDYQVRVMDSIMLGKIEASDFESLGLFSNFEMEKYTEIKYNLRLSPFKAQLNKSYWYAKPDLDLETVYNSLPITVVPQYNDTDETEFKIKKSGEAEYLPLVRSDKGYPYSMVCPGESPNLYVIRISRLVKDQARDSFNNSVTYQIFGFSRKI